MPFWKRREKDDPEPSRDLVPVAAPVEPVEPEPEEEPEREPWEEEDFVWRCRVCGSMGRGSSSQDRHAHQDFDEYVPREVYHEEYEAKQGPIKSSGIWVVVKMPEATPEGEIAEDGTNDLVVYGKRTIRELWDSVVIEADGGMEAIKVWYEHQIADLNGHSTWKEREEANARYVALDFFTGHRSEALITAEWQAKVNIAEGSHE